MVGDVVNVRDIHCPTCGDSDPVQKVSIGDYECVDCEVTFGPRDL